MATTLVARNAACSRERRKPTRVKSENCWYASNTVFW
jgi:hypothetical protein